MTSPIAGLLDARVAAAGAAPLITYYDDSTGERTELSATTLSNWVMKTANLLQDGLDVEAGHKVAVLLSPHWQTAAVLLGTWAVGGVVTETTPAEVLITSEDRLGDVLEPDAEEVFGHLVGVSLRPLGAPMQLRPASVTDYAAEVLLYGDRFAPYSPIDPDALALRAGSLELTARSVVAAAAELAARLGLEAGDRLLVDVEAVRDGGPLPWLLAPLAAGASVVLCRRPDPAGLPRRAETERVTVTMGVHLDGVRAAGG
jgi:uncharacterized protein (TIGR03089 family)